MCSKYEPSHPQYCNCMHCIVTVSNYHPELPWQESKHLHGDHDDVPQHVALPFPLISCYCITSTKTIDNPCFQSKKYDTRS